MDASLRLELRQSTNRTRLEKVVAALSWFRACFEKAAREEACMWGRNFVQYPCRSLDSVEPAVAEMIAQELRQDPVFQEYTVRATGRYVTVSW